MMKNIIKNIRKYYYEKALKKFSDTLEEWLKDKSGEELANLVDTYHLNSFILSTKSLTEILSEIENKYKTISNYFSKHNYEYTPEAIAFESDEIPVDEWLSVNSQEQTGFEISYKTTGFNNKFGILLLPNYLYCENEWYGFVRKVYKKEYCIRKFNVISYLSVIDKSGKKHKIRMTLPAFETYLLKAGYTLLRKDGSSLIYVKV